MGVVVQEHPTTELPLAEEVAEIGARPHGDVFAEHAPAVMAVGERFPQSLNRSLVSRR